MSNGDAEELHLRHLFADAMERRAPVRVSFFKQKKVKVWSERKGRYVEKATGLYVKVTRVVEPYAFQVAANGARSVLVVDRTPEDSPGPDYRTIRLDRVAWSRATGKPLAVRMITHGYLCPTLLDRRPLHPTKRVLASAA